MFERGGLSNTPVFVQAQKTGLDSASQIENIFPQARKTESKRMKAKGCQAENMIDDHIRSVFRLMNRGQICDPQEAFAHRNSKSCGVKRMEKWLGER